MDETCARSSSLARDSGWVEGPAALLPARTQMSASSGTISPSSVPASPVFEWSKIGTDWEADGSTITASGMLAEERYAVGSKVVRSGKTAFTYTINKVFYPDAHMFLGVAEITDDPEKAETWAFSPTTGNLYNGHQLNEHGDEKQRVHLMADPKADLTGKQEGSVITCFIDYDDGPHGSLKFSANGEDPIDSGVKLPESGVRPWVFLYHEGDSVTVEEVC